MYAIYAYIDPPNHPNVGIYGIHGVYGIFLTFWMTLASGLVREDSFLDPFSVAVVIVGRGGHRFVKVVIG